MVTPVEKEYYRKKMKEWRLKNPERNKILRIKYKYSERGRAANLRYSRRYGRKKYLLHPEKYKQDKEYIKKYMAKYMKDEMNHKKYLIRQRDRYNLRKNKIKLTGVCSSCGSTSNLELHHINYKESPWIIDVFNLTLLCRKCHRTLHRKPINKLLLQEVKHK